LIASLFGFPTGSLVSSFTPNWQADGGVRISSNHYIWDNNLSRNRSVAVRANRSQLKNVFWPNIFVGAGFQILDIQQYARGLKLGPAAILNQNPIFERASNNNPIPKGGVL
jgi:hypothetical protein